jgi:periplasmic protein TonB
MYHHRMPAFRVGAMMRRVVMSETGFFAQKRNSPASLGLVILLHGALITAVVLIKSPTFLRLTHPPIVVDMIDDPTVPPADPQRPPPDQPQPQPRQEVLDHVAPTVDTHPIGPTVDSHQENVVVASNTADSGTGIIPVLPPPDPPAPVRRAAQIDSSSRLQPPYPPSEYRLQRDGRVQVRVIIGPDGRVIDVERISATSDAFWQVTREQALRHWRFRPATVDGRPVQDSRIMSLVFRIEDQG